MFDYSFDRDVFKHTEMSYEIDPATHYFLGGREYFLTYPEQHDFKVKPTPGITYKLNNDGHRKTLSPWIRVRQTFYLLVALQLLERAYQRTQGGPIESTKVLTMLDHYRS
jgi:hypothetical protein